MVRMGILCSSSSVEGLRFTSAALSVHMFPLSFSYSAVCCYFCSHICEYAKYYEMLPDVLNLDPEAYGKILPGDWKNPCEIFVLKFTWEFQKCNWLLKYVEWAKLHFLEASGI